MTDRNLTCAELDERLGDYLEGTLDDSSVAAIELHLAGCPSCASLVRDVERITREAAALPALAPSRDLWAGIASRLDAPVIDLAARAAERSAGRRSEPGRRTAPARWPRLRMGAMAAGLVGVTAIGTYLVTSRAGAPTVAVAPAADPAFPAERTAGTPSLTGTPAPGLPPGERVPGATAGPGGATMVNRPARTSARATYDAEIAALRGVLAQRSDELDPRTVAVLETSLATIDSAIAEARQALQGDPASRFLSTQLNKMLEKKLGVLRTAALLPSRT
ncbi:MAG: hypothetical protein ABS52_08990 [Gemmatimonadetes bacterium SCN 70-22]|nr:MAG: hypothetical protein ABS52_08990 [Gemmatimonadetes bacterium SCN 70-22]